MGVGAPADSGLPMTRSVAGVGAAGAPLAADPSSTPTAACPPPPPRLPLTPRWPRSSSSRLPGAVPAACPLPWPARPRSPRAPALPWAPPPGGRVRGAARGPGAAGWGAGGRSTEGRSAARPAERAAPLAPAEGGEAGAGGSAGSPSPTDSLGRRGTGSPIPNLNLHFSRYAPWPPRLSPGRMKLEPGPVGGGDEKGPGASAFIATPFPHSLAPCLRQGSSPPPHALSF